MGIEKTILGNLLYNEEFSRSTLAFIKKEYFNEITDRIIFQLIDRYTQKFNNLPTKETLLIDLEKIPNLSEDNHQKIIDKINNLKYDTLVDKQWLLENTEKWCQNRSVYNAIMDCIKIYDGKEKEDISAIPKLLTDAVSVSFDQYIGHDYLAQADERWEFYNKKDVKIPFEVEMLNQITEGGLSPKTLTVLLAGVHVGKSLMMGSMAAYNLMCGYNVLYVTLELSEEVVSKRIDANLMDIDISEIKNLSKEKYLEKADKLKHKTTGKLIVKEYATASANVNHLRHLLNELKLKMKFIPHIIYVDYLNLMLSARVKGENSYTMIKNIAEELRGLSVELGIPFVTATQLTRGGSTQSDVGMEDTAESFALPAISDLFLAITQTEELKEMNQYLVKQLKNRMGDVSKFTRFVIGVDKPKMKLFDVNQGNIIHDVEVTIPTQPEIKKWDKTKFLDFK